MGIYTFDFGCNSQSELLERRPVLSEKTYNKQGIADLMEHEPYLSEQPDGIVHKGLLSKRDFFVRALFFDKGADISTEVIESMKCAPTRDCYFHFQHMGGMVSEQEDVAFLAREAEWSMVISGVWSETSEALPCKTWVGQVVQQLLPKSLGSYATDLGPDDSQLAQYSFGPKTKRLLELKRKWDPENMFQHGFPLASLAS